MTDRPSDPQRSARLLLAERDALLPLLRAQSPGAFDAPTCLPGWSVRDVLAHCAAAFTMTANRSWHTFSPADNQRDVDARRDWPIADLLAELDTGYVTTADAAVAASGRLDGLALGEWVHGGDVRQALGVAGAYASAGVDDALVLLAERTRHPDREIPRTTVTLSDADGCELGSGQVRATLSTDTATLVRLCAGRDAAQSSYQLAGADPSTYRVFD